MANGLKEDSAGIGTPQWNLREQVFPTEVLYEYVRAYAARVGASQTEAALPYARDCHQGQYRKGHAHIPYIYHPLMTACHALAMGLAEDDLIAALLLHDVCEDCRDEEGKRIRPEALPVNAAVQNVVRIVTKPEMLYPGWKDDYYQGIGQDHDAMLVKLIDRCNNISMMASGFTHHKMDEYILETEHYIVPFLKALQDSAEEFDRRAAFLLRYQLVSDLENCKRLLG